MTDLNMDLKDLTRGQKIAIGVVLLAVVGYAGTTMVDSPSSPPEPAIVVPSGVDLSITSNPSNDATQASLLLGGGPKQADQIRRIAKEHGVSAETVADKAAKVAEMCEQNSFPGTASEWSHASLRFVDEITEPIDLDEAFVMYVVMKCPI